MRFFPNSAAHDVQTRVIKQPRLMALRMVIFLQVIGKSLTQTFWWSDKKSMKLKR